MPNLDERHRRQARLDRRLKQSIDRAASLMKEVVALHERAIALDDIDAYTSKALARLRAAAQKTLTAAMAATRGVGDANG